MSVSGLCQICESATAEHQCNRCGSLVCHDHFDASRGLCADCVAELGEGSVEGDDIYQL